MNDNYDQPQGTTSRNDEVPTILPNERLSREMSTPRHDDIAEAKARKNEAIAEAHAAIEKAISWAMLLAERFEQHRQTIEQNQRDNQPWSCPICTDGKPHHHKALKEIHCQVCGYAETLIVYHERPQSR